MSTFLSGIAAQIGWNQNSMGSFCLPNDMDNERNKGKGARTAITEWMSSDAKTSLVRHFYDYFHSLKATKLVNLVTLCKCRFLVVCILFTYYRHLLMNLDTVLECLMTFVRTHSANKTLRESTLEVINLASRVREIV